MKYTNGSGSPDYDVTPQFTDRAVRQLVKLFDIEEYMLQEDLAELMRRLVGGEKGDSSENNDDATVLQDVNNTLGTPTTTKLSWRSSRTSRSLTTTLYPRS